MTLYEVSDPEQDNDNRWTFKKTVGHWRLTEAQRKAFESTFYNRRRDEHSVIACEWPHYFFRYYSADGVQIGEVIVDPDSKNFHAYPEIFTYDSEVDAQALKALIASIKKPLKRGC